VRTSAQKAGLVMDQIRGRDVTHALATLRFSRKAIARDIEKVLRSAIANAQQRDGFGGDADRLFVAQCWANQGPSMKRIRPAPMGRAFRVVKRMAHLTVAVAERPVRVSPAAVEPGAGGAPRAKRPRAKKPRARKTKTSASRAKTPRAKKTTAKKTAGRAAAKKTASQKKD
jgi:large subunit ribosomal protein L22